MNRNSGNVSKTKKLISGVGNNSKHNRKSLQKLSDSSSISSNRNSSGNSEEDVRVTNVYLKPQVDNNVSYEEQEQITKKLQGQVKELRHKLRVLEESVDSKDYSLGAISREKERAVGEIRRLERTNKQLRQQLNDERNHYLEEKERFCEQMTQYKKKLQESKMIPNRKKSPLLSNQSFISQPHEWQHHKIREKGDFDDSKTTGFEPRTSSSQKLLGSADKKSIHLSTFSLSDCQMNKYSSVERLHLYEGDDVSLQMAALRTENAKLRSIICERDERNYELCLRFLRMKHYKNDIRTRFQDLESEYLQVIANLMDKIDEARQEFNFIIDQKFKRPLHSTNAVYLQMVQKNSKMAFENASLRLENQCLKKKLSKQMSGTMEFERRNDSRLPEDELKNNEKVKRIKKNVNFNEIQTIYERELFFKNSDTDSNYMSKSSTGPSNASLVDPKSNESIAKEEEESTQEKNQSNFQRNDLPDEILNKLFKRIDSGSSQATANNSSRSKDIHPNVLKNPLKVATNPDNCTETVVKEPIIIERKSGLKVTDSSSPCESKESIQIYVTEPRKEPKKEVRKNKNEDLKWTFRNRFKYRNAGLLSGKNSEYGLQRFEFPVRKIILFSGGKTRGEKKQRTNKEVSPVKNFTLAPSPVDCCGLQEKVEFSDLEYSSACTVENLTRTGEKPENPIEIIECEDEDLPRNEGRLQGVAPAVGSRSRSSNKVNLQDELIQAKSRQLPSDRSWVKEPRVQERVMSSNGGSIASSQEKPKSSPRGSKRFSHRLISSSPEQLRNIITESQLESYRVAPVIVGHATTAITPPSTEEADEKILLQLINPSPAQDKTTIFSNQNLKDKAMVEKEIRLSSMNPVPQKSTTELEACSSDFRIPLSSLPTSNSTMEMVDSAAFDRGNILMRTLSAPGLLESSWLEPYNVCEMRDCGTNT